MNYQNMTKAYQNAERQALEEMNDPHLIVLTILDGLLKSMQIFEDNIDVRAGGDQELKSKHFARALTIIYALQSSLDFEKGEPIATNLFQLYEFARQQMIADLGKGIAEGTPKAKDALSEIRAAWHAHLSAVHRSRRWERASRRGAGAEGRSRAPGIEDSASMARSKSAAVMTAAESLVKTATTDTAMPATMITTSSRLATARRPAVESAKRCCRFS